MGDFTHLKSFTELKKNLKKDSSQLKELNVALLADTSSQLLAQAIKACGYDAGLNINLYDADFDQIDLQVFDPESELYQTKPDYILLFHSYQKLSYKYYKLDAQAQINFYETYLLHIENLLNTLSSRTNAKIIFCNFIEHNDTLFGNFANKTRHSLLYHLRKINSGLMDLALIHKNLFINDLSSLSNKLGEAFIIDVKVYINTNMAFSIDFLPHIAKNTLDIIQAALGHFKKCLILDLDNTTWGGIIGDDGIENIQVGNLGIGKAFTELQIWAKKLKDRGIILAICSKNTEEIAIEPFLKHPEMVLRMEDISVFVANWETKVDNIRHIQSILNISFESMVFLDDNPFERNIVRQAIEGITVPELPDDPAEYLPYLKGLNLFETISFIEEDSQRTQKYREEAGRKVLEKTYTNEAEFLESLKMVSVVSPFNKFNTPRIAQLSQRSNQFNLRTVRYLEEDIYKISKSENHFTISFSLEDKFGDYGLISMIVLEKKDSKHLFVETWLMSCRVLKRGMEDFVLATICEIALANGFSEIIGEYIPSGKNKMVQDHYLNLGFIERNDEWVLNLSDYKPKKCYIEAKKL
jgi:FkbH-like protein